MSSQLPGTDAELVLAAREGNQDAFAALYERYFNAIYDFVTRMLRDRAEAADVTQDTFATAMTRLDSLERPSSFKSWIFTIAHRRSLNLIERRKRAVVTAPLESDGPELNPLLSVIDDDRYGDPETSAVAADVSALVWEAASSLDDRTYAVLDLHVRQGLESAEIADVLQVTKGNAYTMVNRMKKSVGDSIGTYLLIRKGSRACEQLAGIVEGASVPPVSPELRRTVDRHVKDCEICQETRKGLVGPLEVFAGLALVPVPAGLKAAIWGSIGAAAAGGGGGGDNAGAATAVGGAATAAVAGAAAGGASAATAGAGVPVGTAAAGGGGGAAATTASGAAAGVWWQSKMFIATLAVVVLGGAGALVWNSTNTGDPADVQVLSSGLDNPDAPGNGTGAGSGNGGTTTDNLDGSGTAGSTATTTTTAPATTTTTTAATTTTLPTTTSTTTTTTTTTTTVPAGVGGAANNDDFTVAASTTTTLPVLANDAGDLVAGTLRITRSPAQGTASVTSAGIVYRAPSGFTGNVDIGYSVDDANGVTYTGAVIVRVTGGGGGGGTTPNLAPSAVNDSVTGVEDQVLIISVLLNDSDPDDGLDTSSLTIVTPPANGTATVVGSALRYQPNANFDGADSIGYRICDVAGACAAATVTVSLTPVNDPPVLTATGPFTIPEDATLVLDPLAGASDVEGHTLTLASFDALSDKGGTVVAGSLIYTPKLNFTGEDTFGFTVVDSVGASTSATVRVIVTASNDPPAVSGSLTFAVAEDTAGTFAVLDQISDPDGPVDPMLIGVDVGGLVGDTVLLGTTTITYTPPANVTGTRSFTIVVGDGVITVRLPITVNILPVNDAPIADDFILEIDEGTPIDFAASGSDVDSNVLSVASVTQGAEGGTVEMLGGLNIRYTPPEAFVGTDTFQYVITDGLATDIGFVTVAVADVDEPPIVTPKIFELWEDDAVGTLIGTIDAVDPDGGPITFKVLDGTYAHVVAVDGDGNMTLATPVDFETDPVIVVEIEVSDVGGFKVVVEFIWEVGDVNEAPVPAGPDSFTVEALAPVGTVIGTFTAVDPDGDDVTYKKQNQSVKEFDIDPKTGDIHVVVPPLFADGPFHIEVVATDPFGMKTGTVITIEVVDTTPAVASNPFPQEATIYTAGSSGPFCSEAPSDLHLGINAIDDGSGVASVLVIWSIPQSQSHPPQTGELPIPEVKGGSYQGSLSFPFGTLEPDEEATVSVMFVVTNGAGLETIDESLSFSLIGCFDEQAVA